jgi:hypothetical protein
MHEETFGGIVVYTVKTFGVMEVCERQGYRKWHLPKYVVFHRNGRALEDFRTRRTAFKWAATNQNG